MEQHVPKDLNPDLLVWNQQCYRYTRDVDQMGTQGIAPLADYHTIHGRRVTASRVDTLPIQTEYRIGVSISFLLPEKQPT